MDKAFIEAVTRAFDRLLLNSQIDVDEESLLSDLREIQIYFHRFFRLCTEDYNNPDIMKIDTNPHYQLFHYIEINLNNSVCLQQHEQVYTAMLGIKDDYYETIKSIESIQNTYLETAPPPSLLDYLTNVNIKEWWECAYPIIEQIATVTDALTGLAVIAAAPISLIKWIRQKLQMNHPQKEYDWICIILKEDKWNPTVLSERLGISLDDAKGILKSFGYSWNPKEMLYVATDSTIALRNTKASRKLY